MEVKILLFIKNSNFFLQKKGYKKKVEYVISEEGKNGKISICKTTRFKRLC